MKALSDDHPTEAELVPATRQTIDKIRRFLVDKHIVTIPSEVLPTVMETPPYARNGGFASMDTPGAYETKATEAFYYVTPPEKEWPAAQKEEHLRMFNRPVLQVVTIHEAFPGHYIQFLNAKQFPTKTRKLDFLRQQRRRLGPLHRADDDRGGLRRRRSRKFAWPSFPRHCCATAVGWSA